MTLPTDQLRANGVSQVSKRYSSGCPVRHMQFRTDNEALAAYDLNLSPEQIDKLRNGKRPVVHQTGENHYVIKPDSVQVVVDLLADGLEVITPIRYKVRKAISGIL